MLNRRIMAGDFLNFAGVLIIASMAAFSARAVETGADMEKVAPVVETVALPLLPAEEKPSDFQSLIPAVEFETYRERADREGFDFVEEELLSALGAAQGAEKRAALLQAVYFYMAHKLYPEALALLQEGDQEEQAPAFSFLAGVASYKMGRYDDAANIFAAKAFRDNEIVAPWRGMANAQRGAYQEAGEDLFASETIRFSLNGDAAEFFLLKAETAVFTGEYAIARNALNAVRQFPLDERERAHRAYLEAKWMIARQRREAARSTFERLVQTGPPPFANRAALDLLKLAVRAGNITPVLAAERTAALRLTWSGGAFEREALAFKAAMAAASGDIAAAFHTRRQLANQYPGADLSHEALSAMRGDISSLFDRDQLSPLDAAKIFYENIDLAPPGREGDELIRNVSDDLAALDLLPQAAELLRHQTFDRLRGPARSQTAADLAALYLKNNQAGEALQVLRSTRMARLPQRINDRRRHLEARALIATDRRELALTLLAEDNSPQAALLRGKIY